MKAVLKNEVFNFFWSNLNNTLKYRINKFRNLLKMTNYANNLCLTRIVFSELVGLHNKVHK